MNAPKALQPYLAPTFFIDSEHPQVVAFAKRNAQGKNTDSDRAVRLYYAVRDRIRYSPYGIQFEPQRFTASQVLAKGVGFCIQKSVLLTAAARALGIPARLGFADVRNHLATERLLERLQSDLFVFHSYMAFFLNGRWVKATPAFNKSLCEKLNVAPLEFDGIHDSLFQPFDTAGNTFMEYLTDHGQFADLPYKRMVNAFVGAYPHLFESPWPKGDFEAEAAAHPTEDRNA